MDFSVKPLFLYFIMVDFEIYLLVTNTIGEVIYRLKDSLEPTNLTVLLQPVRIFQVLNAGLTCGTLI